MMALRPLLLGGLLALASHGAHAQGMYRGDVAHRGVSADAAPREFHRVRWTFPTGGRVVSSPVWHDGLEIGRAHV